MRHVHVLTLLVPLMLCACTDRAGEGPATEDAMQTASDTQSAGGTADDATGTAPASDTSDTSQDAGNDRRGVSAPAPANMPTDPAEADRASAPPMSDPLPPAMLATKQPLRSYLRRSAMPAPAARACSSPGRWSRWSTSKAA